MGQSERARSLRLLRAAGSHPIVRGFPAGAIVVFDGDLRYLCAGGHGMEGVGLTQETIEGRTIFEVFPPDVVSLLDQPYRDALAGRDVTIEIPFGDRTFLHRIGPLTDPTGEVVAGMGFALDITEARQAELALRRSEQSLLDEQIRLREAEAIGHSGSWEWDMVTGVITWSDGLFALHRLPRTAFGEGYAQAASRVHPDDRHLVDAAMEACRRSDETVEFRYRILRTGDGAVRWFDSRATGVFDEGRLVRLIGAVADVTEKVRAEEEVVAAIAFQEAVIKASPDYTFIVDVTTGAVVYGPQDKEILGYTSDQAERLGRRVIDLLVHPEDRSRVWAMNEEARTLENGQVLHLRYRARHRDGQWHWLSRHILPFRRDSSGAVVEVLGILRDITDVVDTELQLSYEALHDQLTGLPNRALLLDRLDAALVRSGGDGREIAVIFCDLDGFKHVNDTSGHAAGDAVLIETARRLRSCVRDGDTVARLGGDEFVIVIEPWNRAGDHPTTPGGDRDGHDRTLALQVADRIVRALRPPMHILGVPHRVTGSIGITYRSMVGPDGSGRTLAADLVDEADAAMYRAKHEGKDRLAVFA
jgi:PAS domain S-box-containing protein